MDLRKEILRWRLVFAGLLVLSTTCLAVGLNQLDYVAADNATTITVESNPGVVGGIGLSRMMVALL